jgi:large subunit ribosomal protein L40
VSDATGKPTHTSTGWTKKAGPKKASGTKTTAESNNPFLQGMNFDRSDSRVALSRRILFSQRPLRGLGLNPQDQIRHETIHRAWLLFQQRRRKARITRLKELQDSVANTLKFLKETDEKLYAMAVSGTRERERRFPLVMRIPTDTLPSRYWNYKWTPVNIKGVGGVAKPG